MIKIVRAKLHGLRVTGCELNYHGSISLDPEICAKAGIYPLEFVEIWNKNSGARITTYVIFGEAGSRCCILNGAAARTCQKDDELIICATEYVSAPEDMCRIRPRVLTFHNDNTVDEVLCYAVGKDARDQFTFAVENLA